MYNPQLETFITVAESGSFAKAADKLYISPTAVIKQINILESNLDIKLFNRTHRGLTLTAAGKSLYSDARYIIRYSHESLERAKNAMQKENGIMHRHITHDACADSGAAVAQNPRHVPRNTF